MAKKSSREDAYFYNCMMFQLGDQNAFTLLWDEIELLVVDVLQKEFSVTPKSMWYDDFMSVARLGVLNAAQKYDLNSPYKFTTYAMRAVRNKVIDLLRSLGKSVKIVDFDAYGEDVSFEEFVCQATEGAWSYIELDFDDLIAAVRRNLTGVLQDLFDYLTAGFGIEEIAELLEEHVDDIKLDMLFLYYDVKDVLSGILSANGEEHAVVY